MLHTHRPSSQNDSQNTCQCVPLSPKRALRLIHKITRTNQSVDTPSNPIIPGSISETPTHLLNSPPHPPKKAAPTNLYLSEKPARGDKKGAGTQEPPRYSVKSAFVGARAGTVETCGSSSHRRRLNFKTGRAARMISTTLIPGHAEARGEIALGRAAPPVPCHAALPLPPQEKKKKK